jgi:hypothetical protein
MRDSGGVLRRFLANRDIPVQALCRARVDKQARAPQGRARQTKLLSFLFSSSSCLLRDRPPAVVSVGPVSAGFATQGASSRTSPRARAALVVALCWNAARLWSCQGLPILQLLRPEVLATVRARVPAGLSPCQGGVPLPIPNPQSPGFWR